MLDLDLLLGTKRPTQEPPLMLDLFGGLGGASEAFVKAGWEVVRVDNEPTLLARALKAKNVTDVVADLRTWSWTGRKPMLVWASPPCTEFSREMMPWCRTGNDPCMDLALAARRIIDETQPSYWVIENVKGAVKWFVRCGLGRHRKSYGPVFLWGNFPIFEAKVEPWKERLSSSRKAERAKIPAAISDGLLKAIEQDVLRQQELFKAT